MNRGLLVSLALVLGSLGCGGSNLTKVSGTITVNGAPVPAGSITFVPDSPGENASGQIGPDGRYELSTSANQPGAAPGAYKVRIAAYKSMPADMKTKIEMAAHRKYMDPRESGLTATVVAGPAQTIDFQLQGP